MNTIYSNYDLEHQSEICVTKIIESTAKRIDVFTYHEGAAFYVYNNIRIYYSKYNKLRLYQSKPYYRLITIDGTQVCIHLLDGTPKICGSGPDEMYLLEAERSMPEDWSKLAVLFMPYGKTKPNLIFTNKVDPLQYPDYKIIEGKTESVYIACIGIDNKQHVCSPDSDVCKCGIKIKRKKLLRDDWKLYSCYECTY